MEKSAPEPFFQPKTRVFPKKSRKRLAKNRIDDILKGNYHSMKNNLTSAVRYGRRY